MRIGLAFFLIGVEFVLIFHCLGCGKAPELSTSSSVFPESLQYSQPSGTR